LRAVKMIMKIYSMISLNCSNDFCRLHYVRGASGRSRQRGFTLVEMMLVVMVIVLLAGAGGGLYRGTYKRMLAEKAARDFLFAAKSARTAAIERQSPCRMELDAENNGFALVIYDMDQETGAAGWAPVREAFKRAVEFSGEVEFEDIIITSVATEELFDAEQEQHILFLPNGTAQTAVVQIGDGRNHYTAYVCAATGRTKLYTGTADQVEFTTIDLDER